MSKGKGRSQEKKRERFNKLHPEGRKAFAQEQRRRKLEKHLRKIKKTKRTGD